mmetsp:Transcript_11299/g.17109  ORF Transcript_11299/g.17109 Transcript_11299/m.17109 type:complete len:80 (-) Transcript_11299:496-735(-)
MKSNKIQLSAEFQEANKLSRQAQNHSQMPSNKTRSPPVYETSHATQFRNFPKNQIMILPDLVINSPLYINKMQVKAGYT